MGKGKLDLYAIGQGGVNVVKNPIALDRDEALLLQNVIYPSLSGEGGLQKRGGLQKKNSAALNGGASILGLADVPLPDPFSTTSNPRQYLYLGEADTNNWTRTADGATWVTQTVPGFPARYNQSGVPTWGPPPIQPIQGRLVYVSGDTDIDDWWMYDGTSDQLVLVVPAISPDPAAYTCGPIGYHLGDFYISTTAVGNPRIYKFNLTTGALTLIGGGQLGVNYVPRAIVSYLGQLFVAATDNSGGAAPQSFVYRCDPANATSWTTDSALLTGLPGGMVNFQGNLYIATGSRNAAVSMNIYKRTPSGVYSTVYTDPTPWGVTNGGALIEFDDKLFAYIGGLIKVSTDGAVWTTDLDVFGTYAFPAVTGIPVIFNNELYWGFGDDGGLGRARVLKRTTAGAWSVSYGPADFHPLLTIFEEP